MAKSESRSCAKEEVWYIDFGCNNHMVGVKSYFLCLMETLRNSQMRRQLQGVCYREINSEAMHW